MALPVEACCLRAFFSDGSVNMLGSFSTLFPSLPFKRCKVATSKWSASSLTTFQSSCDLRDTTSVEFPFWSHCHFQLPPFTTTLAHSDFDPKIQKDTARWLINTTGSCVGKQPRGNRSCSSTSSFKSKRRLLEDWRLVLGWYAKAWLPHVLTLTRTNSDQEIGQLVVGRICCSIRDHHHHYQCCGLLSLTIKNYITIINHSIPSCWLLSPYS